MIAVTTWRDEPCRDVSRRHTLSPKQVFKGPVQSVTKEMFNAVIDHLEVAREKNDACRVAVLEENLLLKCVPQSHISGHA